MDINCKSEVTHLNATVLTEETPILALREELDTLIRLSGRANDITIALPYFLARTRELNSRPVVVAVYERNQLIGVVYGAKRIIQGIAVGVIRCGDLCGDGTGIALNFRWPEVALAAITQLFKSENPHLIRFSVQTNRLVSNSLSQINDFHRDLCLAMVETSTKLSPTSVQGLKQPNRHVLLLPNSYTGFLDSLGRQTRRNMRYYRRRADQAGWSLVTNIGAEDLAKAIQALYPIRMNGHPYRLEIGSFLQTWKSVPNGFCSALVGADKQWISLVAGWAVGGTLFIHLQLNHGAYAKDSVSTVLRGYLIENAIEAGFQDIQWIGGCQGGLSKYCIHDEVLHLIIRKGGFYSLIQLGARVIFPEFARFAQESVKDTVELPKPF